MFKEEEHPRDEDGKFTFKNGGGKSNSSETPAQILYSASMKQKEIKEKELKYKNKLLDILGDKATPSDILYGNRDSLEKKIEELGLMTGDTSGVNSSMGNWQKPVEYQRISSPYGWRYHPIRKRNIFHQGIDLAANANTPVKAPMDGMVVSAKWEGAYGNCVRIKHTLDNGKEITTVYAHLNSYSGANGVALKAGQKIKQGEQIGKVGSTGKDKNGKPTSTGNHLHFEVIYDGNSQNPHDYINNLK